MARAFRCKECGTGYSTTGNDVPPSPNWKDGHICEMVEVESKLSGAKGMTPPPPPGFSDDEKLEMEREARMRIIGQNGNTGEHYSGEEDELDG